MLESLEPQALWKHFETLTQIPRCSKHEEKVRAHVLALAKKIGLEAQEDGAGNVVVYKEGSPGYEKGEPTVLQGHLDMVCEKNRDVDLDFSKDPLKLRIEGEWVKATGTTLGADNGIGVAAALALMEARDIPHGPLEFLFTIDEETGLTGASQLEASLLKGRRMLNLDTEEDGALYIGCAGGIDTVITLPVEREGAYPEYLQGFEVAVTGLRGGHSGVDIHEQRGNAHVLLARVLEGLNQAVSLYFVEAHGGSKRNAIPRESFATLLLDPQELPKVKELLESFQKTFREELELVDPQVTLTIQEKEMIPFPPVAGKDKERILQLFMAMPHGVYAMSLAVPGLVETSTNFAIIQTTQDALRIDTSQRSSVESQKTYMAKKVAALARGLGAKVEHGSSYPGWTPNPASPLLKVCKEVYQELYGKEPEVKAIHAGLECGIIGERVPGMDMVSLGPQIENAHSPDEKVHIPSVKKFWEYLLAILERLG